MTRAGVNPTGPGVDASGQRWAVAVLDDGVERDHPFLADRVIEEACFSIDTDDVVNTDPIFQIAQAFWDVVEAHSTCPRGGAREVGPGSAQPCSDSVPHPDGGRVSICSHGTAVAGVAAGDGKSLPAGGALDLPDAGAAPGAAIVAMQVGHIAACANDWSQPCVGFRDTEVLAALEHVRRLTLAPPEGKGLRIAAVNYSIGGPGRDEICDEFVTDIYDRRGRPFKAMIDTLKGLQVAIHSFQHSLTAPESAAVDDIGCVRRDQRGDRGRTCSLNGVWIVMPPIVVPHSDSRTTIDASRCSSDCNERGATGSRWPACRATCL